MTPPFSDFVERDVFAAYLPDEAGISKGAESVTDVFGVTFDLVRDVRWDVPTVCKAVKNQSICGGDVVDRSDGFGVQS